MKVDIDDSSASRISLRFAGIRRIKMWSHDENREVNDWYAENMLVRCPHCKALNHKYAKSNYTGGEPCVLLSKYCKFCGKELADD